MSSTSEKNYKEVHFRLDPDAYASLEKIAKENHLPMTAVFRACVYGTLDEYGKHTVYPDEDTAEDIHNQLGDLRTHLARMNVLVGNIASNVNQIAKASNTALLMMDDGKKVPENSFCTDEQVQALVDMSDDVQGFYHEVLSDIRSIWYLS